MPHVYKEARQLAGHELVGSGDCVELIKAFAPGLKGVTTLAWRPGEHVVDVAHSLPVGTAIATFEDGQYPQHRTGQHAALFISSAGSGIWVMDQWKNDPKKPVVSLRHIRRQGKHLDGKWRDPSNNAEAFSVIE
ncbi:BPSL0067 family protein [Herbaspirillum sp. SJZ107]|uniref:BPSL0067 family protein n=1 Tax=Herbaspirillum sp. SJZ107 TaxID=2572881 RepID=UPI00116C8680|nr:BPSL0067 family protein [Herbaspirillum sp. SJZ107]TQK10269.1 hypothetical protein FBX97_0185 [Herbaspirillum sp. SJZ107]